jgi:hypothetical protein
MPIRLVNTNPYSGSDLYIEPSMYDFYNSIIDKNEVFHPTMNMEVSDLYIHYLEDQSDFYDFKDENSE